MKKVVFAVLSLLFVALVVAVCAPKELSEEEQKALEAELNQLSDEELDQAIKAVETKDTGALAGQAYYKKLPTVQSKIPKIGSPTLPKDTFLATAKKVQQNRVSTLGCAGKPDGYVVSNKGLKPSKSLCIGGKGNLCSDYDPDTIHSVKDVSGKFYALCVHISTWIECNLDGIKEGTGDIIVYNGPVVLAGGKLICAENPYIPGSEQLMICDFAVETAQKAGKFNIPGYICTNGEWSQLPTEICTDDKDNDGDGLIDCNDADCINDGVSTGKFTCDGNTVVNETKFTCTGVVGLKKTVDDCSTSNDEDDKYTCYVTPQNAEWKTGCHRCGAPLCEKDGKIIFSYYNSCDLEYPQGTWKDTGEVVTGPGCQ